MSERKPSCARTAPPARHVRTARADSPGTGRTGATGPEAPANRVLCNGSHTTVTVQPVPRPLNHLLITVKNTGSKTCDLTYYPVLRFDEMRWVPQPVKESQPQAVTTLQPGESGYAGVLLSAADGSGDGGTTGRKLTVGFQGATPHSDGGPAATPSPPAQGRVLRQLAVGDVLAAEQGGGPHPLTWRTEAQLSFWATSVAQ
ncbi:hypothetical protein GCM10027074_73200 [Streptomyces deserti]